MSVVILSLDQANLLPIADVGMLAHIWSKLAKLHFRVQEITVIPSSTIRTLARFNHWSEDVRSWSFPTDFLDQWSEYYLHTWESHYLSLTTSPTLAHDHVLSTPTPILGEANLLESLKELLAQWRETHCKQFPSINRQLFPVIFPAVLIQIVTPAIASGAIEKKETKNVEVTARWGSSPPSAEYLPTDRYILDPKTKKILEEYVYPKPTELLPRNDTYQQIAVSPQQQTQPCLASHQLHELVEIFLHLEKLALPPLKLSWALMAETPAEKSTKNILITGLEFVA